MNIQELIARYEQEKEDILHYQNSEDWKSEGIIQQSKSVAALEWVHGFIEDLKMLDEPKKVIVPDYVAEWLQWCKYKELSLGYALYSTDAMSRPGIDEWFSIEGNQDRFAEAWLYGYEVEEKPKYYIQLPKTTWGTYLVKGEENELFVWQNATCGTKFTEEEIKAIDERYWEFKVPAGKV